jgi:hypothetical protein
MPLLMLNNQAARLSRNFLIKPRKDLTQLDKVFESIPEDTMYNAAIQLDTVMNQNVAKTDHLDPLSLQHVIDQPMPPAEYRDIPTSIDSAKPLIGNDLVANVVHDFDRQL